jgi:hypothetical protein
LNADRLDRALPGGTNDEACPDGAPFALNSWLESDGSSTFRARRPAPEPAGPCAPEPIDPCPPAPLPDGPLRWVGGGMNEPDDEPGFERRVITSAGRVPDSLLREKSAPRLGMVRRSCLFAALPASGGLSPNTVPFANGKRVADEASGDDPRCERRVNTSVGSVPDCWPLDNSEPKLGRVRRSCLFAAALPASGEWLPRTGPFANGTRSGDVASGSEIVDGLR